MSYLNRYWFVFAVEWLQKYIIDPFLWFSLKWTSQHGSKFESGYGYEASAHLVQIWCRGSLHSSFNKNYVYTHVSYLHPEIILRNSNVCLHSVTSTMALFAIAKHSVDIFNFNKYKNICQAQFEEATHLILIPHWALEDLRDQKLYQTTKDRKTIVITTSGCGSELIFLTQLLTKVAKIRIIYEPWVFFEAYKAYQKGQLCWNKYCNLIKSIMYSFMSVRYPRKPQENNATLVLVLPVYCTPMNVVEVIKKMCPQVKHVFSTRHPLASIRAISQWLKDVIPFGQENILNTLHTDDNVHLMIQRINKNQQNFNYAILMAILMYALSILSYLQNRHLYSVETIFHEDMLEKPIQTIQNLFHQLDMVQIGTNLENTLIPYNPEMLQKQQKDNNKNPAIFNVEDCDLIQKIFLVLKMPFGTSIDSRILRKTLSLRQRKNVIL